MNTVLDGIILSSVCSMKHAQICISNPDHSIWTFQSHLPPFPSSLTLLVLSIYTSFPLNYMYVSPSLCNFFLTLLLPQASFHCPFPFTTQTFLVTQTVKRLSTTQETRVRSLHWEDPLEKEMAIHSSTIAWEIPWTEEPGRLQSMGSQRVGHDEATSLSLSSPPKFWKVCSVLLALFRIPLLNCLHVDFLLLTFYFSDCLIPFQQCFSVASHTLPT